MIRLLARMILLASVVLFLSCSKRERSDPDAEEWADIQTIADEAVESLASGSLETNVAELSPNLREVPVGEFGAFVERLEQMKKIDRKAGEVLLTGKTLVFDHDRRFVRLDGNVKVVDDHGTLATESLIGRFSASNEVEYIEAHGGVNLVSSNRTAAADKAVYNVLSGFVRLSGQAEVSQDGNCLSGEKIELWVRGDHRMVCEPNALLEIRGISGLQLDGIDVGEAGETEIRADRVVYDGSVNSAELTGNVRMRDPRAAMNSEMVRVFLKDDREIDWIEALGGVIIQTTDRKALAEQATYHADEGKFTLLGEPKVSQGPNVMTGDRIIFWHETRRIICEPNARVLLYLDADTKAKFLNDLNE